MFQEDKDLQYKREVRMNPETLRIRWHGRSGQGAKTAANVLKQRRGAVRNVNEGG